MTDAETAVCLIARLKNIHAHPFQVPYQPVYAHSLLEFRDARYSYIVDGVRMAASDYLPRHISENALKNAVNHLPGELELDVKR